MSDHPDPATSDLRAALLDRWARGEIRLAPLGRSQGAADGPDRLLTFDQEFQWRHSQGSPGDAGRNQYLLLKLTGPLDVRKLESALTAVIARHEILRTRYPTTSPRPRAVVSDEPLLSMTSIDLSALQGEALLSQVHEHCAEAWNRPFDLNQPPLFKVLLLSGGERLHWLLFLIDHIIFDGWSLGLLFRDLQALYNGSPAGAALPPPGAPFTEFAAIERGRASAGSAAVVDYVARLFRSPDYAPELATDVPRQHGVGNRQARLLFAFPEQAETVRQAALRFGATPHSLLTACFALFLAAESRKRSIMFYTVAANRNLPQFQQTIGPFRGTVLLRFDLEPDDSVETLLPQVRAGLRNAVHMNESCPVSVMLERAIADHGAKIEEVFRVGIVVQNFPTHLLSLNNLSAEIADVYYGGGGQDISLIFSDTDALSGYVRYNSALFHEESIRRLLDRFVDLMDSALVSPSSPR